MKGSTLTLECQRCHKNWKLTLPQLKTVGTKCPSCGGEHCATIVGSFTRPSNIALST